MVGVSWKATYKESTLALHLTHVSLDSGCPVLKIYVSIDFEGLPGVSSVSQLLPRSPQYSDGRHIVTEVAAALVDALRSHGVEEVLVADSHGFMANIYPWKISAPVLQGYPRPVAMIHGIEGYDALVLVGYHAGAGMAYGFLDHTYSGATIQRVIVNGEPASEYLLNAIIAGEKGVPVILVAGDEKLRPQVEKYTPWAVFVGFKKGVSRYAAVSIPLEEAKRRLREAVSEALKKLKNGEAKPLRLSKPYQVVVEVKNPGVLDVFEQLGIGERKDSYTIAFQSDNAEKIMAVIQTLAFINLGLNSVIQMQR